MFLCFSLLWVLSGAISLNLGFFLDLKNKQQKYPTWGEVTLLSLFGAILGFSIFVVMIVVGLHGWISGWSIWSKPIYTPKKLNDKGI